MWVRVGVKVEDVHTIRRMMQYVPSESHVQVVQTLGIIELEHGRQG